MRFEITKTNNEKRYIQARSKKQAEVMEERLSKLKKIKQIKDFQHLEFEIMKPDQLLKT